MAGTPHGIHSIVSAYASNEIAVQAQFCRIIAALDHVEAFGYCTRIASYYGLTGTGFGMPGSGAEPGRWAFAVYRWNANAGRTWEWYLLVQFGMGSAVGSGGEPTYPMYLSDPNLLFASAVAFDQLGAPANPWRGTVLNNGADSKAATVWGKPTGHVDERVYAWPRCNDTGGTYATNKQSLAVAEAVSSSNYYGYTMRSHVLCDADGFFYGHDRMNEGESVGFIIVAPYTPLDGLSARAPLFMLTRGSVGEVPLDVSIGAIGTSNVDGGVFSPKADQVNICRIYTRASDYTETAYPGYQSNHQFTTKTVTAVRIPLYVYEAPYQGFLGYLDDFVMLSSAVVRGSTLQSKSYVGLLSDHLSNGEGVGIVKWDGVTADPMAGNSSLGVTF